MSNFTFTSRNVHDFEDVSKNFEQLEQLLTGGSGQQAGVVQLLSLQQLALAYGTGTLTWPGGSAYSNTLSLNTGLGRTVLGAALTASSVALGSYEAFIAGAVAGDGTLTVQGVTTGTTANPALNATANFLWIAVG